jgi:hypothetical protein
VAGFYSATRDRRAGALSHERLFGAALARHFVFGDRELVALAGADNELALAAAADLAGVYAAEQ